MLLIDPMHNLYLGTAKNVTHKIYIGMGKLSKVQLDVIHKKITNVCVSVYIGRSPSSMETGSMFTAVQ